MSDTLKATRRLVKALTDDAARFAAEGRFDDALSCQWRAYSLSPGNANLLHDASPLYRQLGDNESAELCRRGVIPEHAESRWFNAVKKPARFVLAKKAAGSRLLKAHAGEKRALPAPERNTCEGTRPEFRARQTDSRGTFVSALDNGSIWFDGFNTLVKDCKGQFVQEHVKGNAWAAHTAAVMRPTKSVNATVCFIDSRSSSIYYHWLLDVLPKIAVLSKAGINIDDVDYFVVNAKHDFQRETLETLGVSAEQLITPDACQSICASTLLVPYLKHDLGDRVYRGLGLGMGTWVPEWMRKQFVPDTQLPQNEKERIYISRTTRGVRELRDESKLISALEARGFSSVTLEELSVSDQARLLASTKVVVAPHGAGLGNTVFCQPGTLVIEVFGNYVVPCYWALATVSSLKYRQYLAHDAIVQNSISNIGAGTVQQASKSAEHHIARDSEPPTLAERRQWGIEADITDLLNYIDHWLLNSPSSKR